MESRSADYAVDSARRVVVRMHSHNKPVQTLGELGRIVRVAPKPEPRIAAVAKKKADLVPTPRAS